ncbi:tRNA 2-selenouridine(34) synthase MnmH [Pollutimonas bauzanensis]|uniref:tRNA 2-selenouridine synthase n=1 Tax=Pollutimonas bauzanensis TaxID=658167 RepID=A0A1M5WCH2_9BURK|nr:tRNA 2-selenouridine(34) synthase MnmH [Pollutimonas bauzanensis]SHH84903.1 tRNA 2-selenouridine synthase [Pollutimonas bauzanensis]
MRDDCGDYRRIFLGAVPLMDVRAPVEFCKGAFPLAVNLPLMDDGERQKVGTCYKAQGQKAAIELGHRLVSGRVKAQRVAAWAAFAQDHPAGYLYCFRGGLRSQISQQWLSSEAGIDYPRVAGGYKAMRGFLGQTVAAAVAECDFVLVGGLTGSGKTELLAQLEHAVDLEGHAHHRGSSFGKHATPQPRQIDFEHGLAIDLLKKRDQGMRQFVLEDESRLIGSCSLPLALYSGMQQYPLVWLEDSFEGRVERILRDYIVYLLADFVAAHGEEDGFSAFAARLRESLANIVKRLGGERYQRLAAIMDHALAEQRRSGSVELHRGWIASLLGEYYDPIYASQRDSKAGRVEFRGDHREVREYLRHRRLCAGDRRASKTVAPFAELALIDPPWASISD